MSGSAAAGSTAAFLPPTVFPVHETTRYLRTTVSVSNGVLHWDRPRSVLGIIPAGRSRVEIPIDDIESAGLRSRFFPVRKLVGVALGIAPWFFVPWWAAIVLAALGVWILLVSFGPQLDITTVSGKAYVAPVCAGHGLDADLFAEALNDIVARTPAG